MKKIERLSPTEIAAIRGEQANFANKIKAEQPVNNKKNGTKTDYYISKLKDSDIVRFFIPLGYVSHQKTDAEFSEPFVIVTCDTLTIFFNDYTTRVYERPVESALVSDSNSKIEFVDKIESLKQYAETTNTTIENLISNAVAVDLFGTLFPETYASKKKKYDQNNIDQASKKLPVDLQRFLGSAKEMQKAETTAKYNMNTYGMANIEDKLKNS